MGSVRSTPIDTQAPSTCCFLSGGSTDELLCGCLLQAVTASRVCVCVCVCDARNPLLAAAIPTLGWQHNCMATAPGQHIAVPHSKRATRQHKTAAPLQPGAHG